MTIIDTSDINNINYKDNIIKYALLNNDPIEEKLNVVMVISNPCQYKTRYKLAKEFITRILDELYVNLYIVELIYENQEFYITDKLNKNHLQIKTKIPLWHKENMINIGIQKLLPSDWKAVAWIDADIEFDNPTWALDTLKILNGTKDIVQLYSTCLDMDQNKLIHKHFNSFGYKYEKKEPYNKNSLNYWHPGFAWACTKKAYIKMGGLYDFGILGSGDNIMALSLIQNGLKAIPSESTDDYKNTVLLYQDSIKHLRLGYVPGIIIHYFHGLKVNRQYGTRYKILINHLYSPLLHVTKDKDGIIIPTSLCPQELIEDIYKYFVERNEDEFNIV